MSQHFADALSLLSSGASATLSGNPLSTALSAMQIVNKLSSVVSVAEPIGTDVGMRKRVEIVMEGLAEAAKLTGTPYDDKVVELVKKVVEADEVISFLVWTLNNLPKLAEDIAALNKPAA